MQQTLISTEFAIHGAVSLEPRLSRLLELTVCASDKKSKDEWFAGYAGMAGSSC